MAPPTRLLLLTTLVAFFLIFLFYIPHKPLGTGIRSTTRVPAHPVPVQMSQDTLKGEVVMGKLGNETLKAELGRAAWKLFHTTMARIPDQPSEEESEALRAYVWLFARLYPCGECASHFKKILNKFPPQVSTRSMAAAWACHVHNEVNKDLKKPLFDCSKIGDFYDCGCGDDEEKKIKASTEAGGKREMDERTKTKLIQDGRDINMDFFRAPVQVAKGGLTQGG